MQDRPRKRVFIVDDEQIIATTLGLSFNQSGFDAVPYFDPLQLLSACETEVPDAVISVVMMPHMTGIDLALRLGELYPECRVVLMSGQAATLDLLKEASARGQMLEVLSKPVPPATLIEHMRQLLA